MLIHARTDTAWFHEFVYGKAELRFIKGRLHFNDYKWNAPFPSMLAIYRPEEKKCKTTMWKSLRTALKKRLKGTR